MFGMTTSEPAQNKAKAFPKAKQVSSKESLSGKQKSPKNHLNWLLKSYS